MRLSRPLLDGIGLALLLGAIAAPAIAYAPDEVSAILGTPRRPLSPAVERVVLASQRAFAIHSDGTSVMEEHRIMLAGPAASGRDFAMRWALRPGLDRFRLVRGRVHHPGGAFDPIPADSVRVEPHRAAGAKGYPGVSDFVVHPPRIAPGDRIEVQVVCSTMRICEATEICGEYCFADADSVVESELNLEFPSGLAMLVWDFGDLPDAVQSTNGGDLAFRWITGHLPAMRPVVRTAGSAFGGVLPDSMSPPTIFYAFQTAWSAVVAARSTFWGNVMERTPPELMAEMRHILDSTGDPVERRDMAVAWVHERLREIELPSTRAWYEPVEPEAIMARDDAIPRDRAMILVWLLRHVGVGADVVTVRSRPGASTEVAMPQQFDLWIVRTRIGASEPVWIDPSSEGEPSRRIPPGPAIVWTTNDPERALADFPGMNP